MTNKLAALISEIPASVEAQRQEMIEAWRGIGSTADFDSWKARGSLALLRRNDLGGLADRIAACR